MVQRWRAIALGGFLLATWLGCSGTSKHGDSEQKSAGKAGQSAAGQSGVDTTGGSGGTNHGTGGSNNEGGNAGDDGTITEAGHAAMSTGGKAGRGGSSAGGGMFGTGAFAGTLVNGGTAGHAGSVALAGAAGSSTVPNAWGCPRVMYGDGKCDCGCGVMDPDCTKQDLAHCEVCNDSGSCNRAECPGRIDPSDITKCLPAPTGWTCTPAAYGDGTTCDCGCGVEDLDCPDREVSSCDSCQTVGTCGNGPCPSNVIPTDNRLCAIPTLWTCDHESYGNGVCNCGCGDVDIDCADETSASCEVCAFSSCAYGNCDAIDPLHNAFCTTPPSGWRCAARLYRDGVQCDCGCGVTDPDCDSKSGDVCDKCDDEGSCSAQACPGLIDPNTNASCDQPPAPAGWTCYSQEYGDGSYCECGCGVPDPDCRTGDISECEDCYLCGGNCATDVDPNDTTKCGPAPAGWTCSAGSYRDNTCDCGCGIPDPSCSGIEQLYVCQNYPVEGCSGGIRSHISPSHNELCTINVPSTWTCNRAYYGDGLCDCGCGALDPDCSKPDATVCAKCNDTGSCSTASCPGTIDTSDNAHCTN